jgi:DNA-binding helix-hairpin-helix protein with protein kinase domain
MTTAHDDDAVVGRARLGRLDRLGKGGTAVVYRLPGFHLPGLPTLVFKEYNEAARRHAGPALRTGLLSLVQHRLRMDDDARREWDRSIAWPLRVVVDDGGSACGILLPLIPERFFQDVTDRTGARHRDPREVDMLFGATADMARIGLPAATPRDRLRIAVQIVKVYRAMHDRGMIVGDISGRNMVYDVSDGRPRVLVVDADGSRVEGSRGAFGSQPQTPHWEPPEALLAARKLKQAARAGRTDTAALVSQTMVQNRRTDVYKLALMLVRVLDHGRGKAVNRDPKVAADLFRTTWGPHAAGALERCLSPQPSDRPSIRGLYEAMHKQPPTPPGPTKDSTTGGIAAGTKINDWIYRDGFGWVRNVRG